MSVRCLILSIHQRYCLILSTLESGSAWGILEVNERNSKPAMSK